mgnify:CR=1 FL=1
MKRRVVWYVHDLVAHAKEVLTHQRLSEEVRDVICRGHEGDTETPVLHALADEVVTPVDVLRPRVVFGVVGQVDSRLVVHLE